MQQSIFLLVLTALCGLTYAGKLPPDYPRCKHDDSNFSECMLNAARDVLQKLENGIPSLNVPPLQPLYIPSITIGEGKGVVNVVQEYTNFNLYGLLSGKFERFDTKLTDNDLRIEMDLLFPEVRFEADYSLNGRVLLLPIVGDGKCIVTLQQLKSRLTLYAEASDKKGKKYLNVKDNTLALTPGKVIYNFENLFNGDERLGAEMNKVLNDNWKEVYDDIGDQYETMLQTVFGDYTNKIFSKVPFEDLF